MFQPSLSLPTSRAFQQSWAVTPISNSKTLNTLGEFYSIAARATYPDPKQPNTQILLFRDGTPPVGCLQGVYRDKYVWIPVQDYQALGALSYLTKRVMQEIEKGQADKDSSATTASPIKLQNTQPQALLQ